MAKTPSDGVYSVRKITSAGDALAYLQRFERNPNAIAQLAELVEDDEEKDEDEEEDDEQRRKRGMPVIGQAAKNLEILRMAARLIASGALGIAEQVARFNPPTKLDEVKPDSPAAPPPEEKKTEKKTTWIEIKVINDQSGEAVNWVRMVVKTPDGNETFYTTNKDGLIRIDDLPPGTCDAHCDLKGATLKDTYAFVAMGEAKPTGGGPSGAAGSSTMRIANIEEHKVKKGESIASLASKAGMKWQDLAKFNWGTDVPDKINEHLRDDVVRHVVGLGVGFAEHRP